MEKFRYNVIIAVYHEVYSFFKKIAEKNKNYKNLKENFKKILTVMMPVLPHIANECYKKYDFNEDINWPKVDENYIVAEKNEVVIQVNGKKRNVISIEKDTTEEVVLKKIEENKLIEKYVDGKKIIKTIFVKDRLINYIIK